MPRDTVMVPREVLANAVSELKNLLAMCEGEVPSLLEDHFSYPKIVDAIEAGEAVLSSSDPEGGARGERASVHGDGNCGCTERCKNRDNCQYDVEPPPLNDQDEVLLAYGLLWCVNTTDKRVHAARRELLNCLNRELQAKGITAARTTLALIQDIRQMKGATFAADFDAKLSKTPSAGHDAGNLRILAESNHQPHAVSQGWRDIETAPRGTPILCGAFKDGAWHCIVYEIESDHWREEFEWVSDEPTHWTSLPAPPSPAKTGGAED